MLFGFPPRFYNIKRLLLYGGAEGERPGASESSDHLLRRKPPSTSSWLEHHATMRTRRTPPGRTMAPGPCAWCSVLLYSVCGGLHTQSVPNDTRCQAQPNCISAHMTCRPTHLSLLSIAGIFSSKILLYVFPVKELFYMKLIHAFQRRSRWKSKVAVTM
jgi:hypothetical protein